MVFINYDEIINEIEKQTTIGGIKMVRKSKNSSEDFFSQQEKYKFINSLLDQDLSQKTENVKKTAILFAKVKKAYLSKTKDVALLKDLTDERTNNSIPYQVLNYRDEYVDRAIDQLRVVGSKDFPQGKDAIEARIRQIGIEVEKLKTEQSKKNIQRRNHLKNDSLRKTKLAQAEDTLRKKENLLTVLKCMSDGKDRDIFLDTKGADGKWETQALSAFTNLEINNYSNDNLQQSVKDDKGNDTLVPLDITKGKTQKKTGGDDTLKGNALELLTSATVNAKGFLDAIKISTMEERAIGFKNNLEDGYDQRY